AGESSSWSLRGCYSLTRNRPLQPRGYKRTPNTLRERYSSAEIHGHLNAGSYSGSSEQFQKAGSLVMFKHLIALVLVALAIVFVSPAVAQQPPGRRLGTLTCKLAPSVGLIFGSRQRMACRFTPNGPNPPEAYVGVMGTIGLDIGITAGGAMAWGVFAPTAGPRRGALAGAYVGASGAIGVGVGVGANLLFGGTGRSIAFQPLSVEGSVAITLSLRLSSLTLTLAQGPNFNKSFSA